MVHHHSYSRGYNRGYVVRSLPSSSVCVTYGSSVYYRSENVYYQPCSTGYVIVEPPPTVIYTAPAPVVYTAPAPVIYTPPAPVYQVVSQPAPWCQVDTRNTFRTRGSCTAVAIIASLSAWQAVPPRGM